MIGVQIGAGNRPIDGFINIDSHPGPNVTSAIAQDLFMCDADTVDVIFSNAVFEHLDPEEYDAIFYEWNRALTTDGMIVALGIPDFVAVAYAHSRDRLSLDHVYRYLVGELPAKATNLEHYKASIHKRLFTPPVLHSILPRFDYNYVVFTYVYPGESDMVNLGFIASNGSVVTVDSLASIPDIERFIDLESIIIQ